MGKLLNLIEPVIFAETIGGTLTSLTPHNRYVLAQHLLTNVVVRGQGLDTARIDHLEFLHAIERKVSAAIAELETLIP